ncbi:2Fe-2S ferredoxin [Rhizobium aquaticum]|uniref:2Fe-2S ferredoxin n=1 Tax=Rhizobium aquaticum TaxID=1549636 RepID=A0ABV2J684_9HYPH
MPNVIFVRHSGEEIAIDVKTGESLMQAATRQSIQEIVGVCGGSMSCGTCHVFVEPDFFEKTGEIGDTEDVMLDLTATDRRETSRLSCQIVMAEALAGLRVHMPESQL